MRQTEEYQRRGGRRCGSNMLTHEHALTMARLHVQSYRVVLNQCHVKSVLSVELDVGTWVGEGKSQLEI
jgi:hypothetical protein